MMDFMPCLVMGGFLAVIILIILTGNRLVKYMKQNYPDIYEKNIEQRGLLIDSLSPNLYLISGEARKLAKKDVLYKTLRMRYGFAWLMLPTWLFGSFIIIFFLWQ
jgi:hypothetical protein